MLKILKLNVFNLYDDHQSIRKLKLDVFDLQDHHPSLKVNKFKL